MRNNHFKIFRVGLLVLSVLCLVTSVGIAQGFFHKRKQPAVSEDHFKKLKIERPKEKVPAPDFTLEDLNGRKVSLKGLKGKVIFLNFWAIWCPPCVQEMPTMEKLHKTFGQKGLTVLAINYREDAKEVKEFFSKHKLTFIALLDLDGKVSERFRAWGLPVTVIINKRGEIVGKVIGSRDWHSKEAKEFFAKLLAEKP